MSSLRSYEPSIQLRIEQLCAQLDKYALTSAPVDLQQWIHYYVFDVMTDLAWGGGGNATSTDNDPDGSIASLRYSLHLAGMTKALPWFAPLLTSLPWIASKTKAFRDFSRNMFLQRQSMGSSGEKKTNDVFHHLLGESHADGLQLSVGALQADSRQVVTGGADTTVSAITYLFFCLLCSPDHYRKLQAALEEVPQTDDHFEHQQLSKCVLLDAYINEALRLQPPIPYQSQRMVPPGGYTVAGIHLSGGTNARTAIYAIARLPENFEQPDDFLPERWFADGSKKRKDNLKASMPFITGPYHFVGRNFAMMEMRMVTAELVLRYEIEIAGCQIGMAGDSHSGERWKSMFEESIEDRSVLEIETELLVTLRKRQR